MISEGAKKIKDTGAPRSPHRKETGALRSPLSPVRSHPGQPHTAPTLSLAFFSLKLFSGLQCRLIFIK